MTRVFYGIGWGLFFFCVLKVDMLYNKVYVWVCIGEGGKCCAVKHISKSANCERNVLFLKTFPLKCLVDVKKPSTFASAIEKQTVLL